MGDSFSHTRHKPGTFICVEDRSAPLKEGNVWVLITTKKLASDCLSLVHLTPKAVYFQPNSSTRVKLLKEQVSRETSEREHSTTLLLYEPFSLNIGPTTFFFLGLGQSNTVSNASVPRWAWTFKKFEKVTFISGKFYIPL